MKVLVITVNLLAVFLISKGQSTENFTEDYEETSAFDDYGSSTEPSWVTSQPNLISENPSGATKYCTRTELVVTNVTEFNYTWSFLGVVDYFKNLGPKDFHDATLFVNNTNLKFNSDELPGNWSVFIRKEEGESCFSVIMKLEPEESTCHLDIRPYLSSEHPGVYFDNHLPLINGKGPRQNHHQMNDNHYYSQPQMYNNNFESDDTSPHYNYNNYSNNNNYTNSYNNYTMSHQDFARDRRPQILDSIFEWKFKIMDSRMYDYSYSSVEDLSIFNLNFHVIASEKRFETQQLNSNDC